jgi:hypothetical protein
VAVPDLPPSEARDGRRRRFRSRGMLVRQSVNSSLVSVAGLIRAPVRDLESHDVGRLVDVRWDRGRHVGPRRRPGVHNGIPLR